MTVREETQTIERLTLSPYAALSEQSFGRRTPEPEDDLRTCYQRDRDRILHCKSFRRLKQKTQVFLSPEGDHYRTRLTHTLEVSQIARTIARALRLNEDLTEAIALGHDLGHTPYGHAGERALNRLCPGGITHTKGAWARTMEGCTVRYADHIAFLNHDIEDAVAAGVLNPAALPRDAVQVLGDTKSRRITTMITDLVANSANCKNGKMQFSPEVEEAYGVLKDFMYSTVYVDKDAKREEKKVDKMIEALYERLCADPTLMPNFYMQVAYHQGMDRAVADYISGMSDEFATRLFEELFVPQKWQVL